MSYSIYENLRNVLNIGVENNKLSYYQAMTGRRLDDDLQYENLEEGLASYLCNLEGVSSSGYSKRNIEEIKRRLGIRNIYDERDFFAKLFMRDYESKNNDLYSFREHIDIRSIFSHFASDELKNDLEFSRTIVTLEGKYLSGMDEKVRSNDEIVMAAIKNDTSKEIESFLSASGSALRNSKVALQYFKKKKENNSYLSSYEVYETIFKKDENENFPQQVFKDNVQNDWLTDHQFLAGLAKLNIDFVTYIVEGKISISSKANVKVKK